MRSFTPAATLAFILLIGCSVPELEQREPKITMAPWPKQTNELRLDSPLQLRTLREAREASRTVREARTGQVLTPFQAYDDKVTGAIQKRWWDLIARLPRQSGGRVVLDFKMKYDGQVDDLKVTDTNVPDNYIEPCKKAVLDGVPYDSWPRDMRKAIGNNYRDVTFRFYYD